MKGVKLNVQDRDCARRTVGKGPQAFQEKDRTRGYAKTAESAQALREAKREKKKEKQNL